MVVGVPQVSGLTLSMGMQSLGPNQRLSPSGPPKTPQNGYATPQHQSYFTQQPTSPTANDGHHFQLSSQPNSPQSPPKFRSSLTSALQNQDVVSDLPRSASSFNVLGPLDAPFPSSVDLT